MIKTNTKNFWIAQCIGWGMVSLSNTFVQWYAGLDLQLVFTNTILPFVVGVSITSLFRRWYKKVDWTKWSLLRMIGFIGTSTFLQTILMVVTMFVLIKLLLFSEVNFVSFLANFMIFGIILLAWNALYFGIYYFNHWHYSEIEKWQLAAEIKDAQLGSLKSQINPHFVFNAINNIRSLILEDPEKARDMLMNFSDLFRYSLTHSDNSTVLLKEELEVVNQYLELLSIQFEEKLEYRVEVEDRLLEEKIPPMILQILIENAVKHGISQRRKGGLVEIHIQELNKQFLIQVKNTGSLNSKMSIEESLGVGLENIKKRLSLIYNGQANFTMSEQNNMVVASINIPLL